MSKDIGKATCGWKHPRPPSVELLWSEEAAEAALAFLRNTRAGCIVTLRPTEEEAGGTVRKRRADRGRPR